ncbi:hypothetical protein M5K25_008390 [Dendrobium thyrsiflorum]|uniref:Uncharacterized protein n=1 Tax=Dendrobium thyrsiflorum TaxID=117978 RepID=A0ABD0VFR3_DENTH
MVIFLFIQHGLVTPKVSLELEHLEANQPALSRKVAGRQPLVAAGDGRRSSSYASVGNPRSLLFSSPPAFGDRETGLNFDNKAKFRANQGIIINEGGATSSSRNIETNLLFPELSKDDVSVAIKSVPAKVCSDMEHV